jgi:hypothetical protein
MTYLAWTIVLQVAVDRGRGALNGNRAPGMRWPTAIANTVRPERAVHTAHDSQRFRLVRSELRTEELLVVLQQL